MLMTCTCWYVFVILALVGSVRADDYYPLGRSMFLPRQDIVNPTFDGKDIFEAFDPACFRITPEDKQTTEKRSSFRDTNTFYKKIATDSGISAHLQGPYTMGTTLNIKTQYLSSETNDISGTSIDIWIHVSSTSLEPKCYRGPQSKLDRELIKHLNSLPVDIRNPELASSWIQYENFLKTYGTHLVSEIHYGARMTQWTFAKKEHKYSSFQLNVRSCADFEGPTQVGKLDLEACAGFTGEEAKESLRLEMSRNLDLLGGTDETRNALRRNRSQELITKFLNEGRNEKSPIDYTYTAIWEILMMKFRGDPRRHAIAMNMQQYYEGFKDFGCSLIEGKMGELKNKPLRQFRHGRFSTKGVPSYECHLEKEGCHNDEDCHIGGAGSVTYCYGHSCVEYLPASMGSKAKDVTIRDRKHGSYDEGVNRSCYYALCSQTLAKCDESKFTDMVIWHGISNFATMLASYNLAPPKF